MNYKILLIGNYIKTPSEAMEVISSSIANNFEANNISYDIISSRKIYKILFNLYKYKKIIFTMGPGNGTYFLTFLLSLLRSPDIFWIASRPVISFSFLNQFLKKLKKIYYTKENFYLNKIITSNINCVAENLIIGFDPSRLIDCKKESDILKKKIVSDKSLQKPTLIHIGHCNPERGLDILIDIKNYFGDMVNIIFFASKINFDLSIYEMLRKNNVIVYTKDLKSVSLAYHMADMYLFTVNPSTRGSIDFPLTVLEALHMRLPVVTTKIKLLHDHFAKNKNVLFVKNNNFIRPIKKLLAKSNFNHHHKLDDKFYIQHFIDKVIKDISIR